MTFQFVELSFVPEQWLWRVNFDSTNHWRLYPLNFEFGTPNAHLAKKVRWIHSKMDLQIWQMLIHFDYAEHLTHFIEANVSQIYISINFFCWYHFRNAFLHPVYLSFDTGLHVLNVSNANDISSFLYCSGVELQSQTYFWQSGKTYLASQPKVVHFNAVNAVIFTKSVDLSLHR